MVRLRAEKVEKIADYIPLQKVDSGNETGKICVLGWGSTYGSIKTAVQELHAEGIKEILHYTSTHEPVPEKPGNIACRI